MGLLIRGILCAFSRTGLNLVEVALPEQKLSVITGHNEFEILEETGDYKWLKNGNRAGLQWIRSIICSLGIEEEEQRIIAILTSSHGLINKMEMRKVTDPMSICQSEISG